MSVAPVGETGVGASPRPVSCTVEVAPVSVEVGGDGVAFVTVGRAGGVCSVLNPAIAAALEGALHRIERDRQILGAVLQTADPDPAVYGLDVGLLTSVRFATDAERYARGSAEVLTRLERLGKPVVAIVRGACVGPRFEIALACHAVLASDKETYVGLPEAELGVIPSGLGLQRIAARSGLQTAIDVGARGARFTAAKALALGLVDEVCPDPVLLDAAARRAEAMARGPSTRGRRPRRHPVAAAWEANVFVRAFWLAEARQKLRAEARWHRPAAERVVDVVERLAAAGEGAAAAFEAKVFGELVVGESAHRLIELAVARASLDAEMATDGADVGDDVAVPARVGVVGGGLMGSGIAFVSIAAGASVRLSERDDAAAGRALRRIHDFAMARVEAGEWTRIEGQDRLARVTAATDASGLRHADVVVEAAFEDLTVKQTIVRELEATVGPRCVIASCTSSLPVARIAEVAASPERVLGMHYFSPVPRMPLVEIARGQRTAAWAVGVAAALARRQGKTVIVVEDGPGFFTARVLAPLVNEAARMLEMGVAVEAIDDALVEWGFPVGPLQLVDEIGVDVAARVADRLYDAFGDRMAPARSFARLVAADRTGRKGGRGIYSYDGAGGRGRPRRRVDAGLYRMLDVEPEARLPPEEIQMRCALSLVTEAIRCLSEGVVRDVRDGDVGAVLGLGFPAFRGGPFRYVDTLGAAETLRRVQSFADRFGDRWRPPPLLVQMARRGERFYP